MSACTRAADTAESPGANVNRRTISSESDGGGHWAVTALWKVATFGDAQSDPTGTHGNGPSSRSRGPETMAQSGYIRAGVRWKGAAPQMAEELGLDKSEVRLAPYNPEWAALGRHECDEVAALLGDLTSDVVHVGSTSVPGIEAKPILDIVAAVGDEVRIDDVVARLCANGHYIYEGDKREDGGLLFVRGHDSFRTAHVHVVGTGSQAWKDYLRFHILLIRDPEARERYQAEKRRLAREFPHDRQEYTRAKSAVVEELLGVDGRSPAPHQA
jgi:GrpB-like predicted nucleotidyltransferase (UPF0157 family)